MLRIGRLARSLSVVRARRAPCRSRLAPRSTRESRTAQSVGSAHAPGASRANHRSANAQSPTASKGSFEDLPCLEAKWLRELIHVLIVADDPWREKEEQLGRRRRARRVAKQSTNE